MFQKFGVKGFEVFSSFLDIITYTKNGVNFWLGFGNFLVKEGETFQTVLKLIEKDVFQRLDVFLIDRVRFLVEP